jgi:hypothetical protein
VRAGRTRTRSRRRASRSVASSDPRFPIRPPLEARHQPVEPVGLQRTAHESTACMCGKLPMPATVALPSCRNAGRSAPC